MFARRKIVVLLKIVTICSGSTSAFKHFCSYYETSLEKLENKSNGIEKNRQRLTVKHRRTIVISTNCFENMSFMPLKLYFSLGLFHSQSPRTPTSMPSTLCHQLQVINTQYINSVYCILSKTITYIHCTHNQFPKLVN